MIDLFKLMNDFQVIMIIINDPHKNFNSKFRNLNSERNSDFGIRNLYLLQITDFGFRILIIWIHELRLRNSTSSIFFHSLL